MDEKNIQNNVNQKEDLGKLQEGGKTKLIVLVLILLVLMLAIGFGAGILFSKNSTKIINDTKENQKVTENKKDDTELLSDEKQAENNKENENSTSTSENNSNTKQTKKENTQTTNTTISVKENFFSLELPSSWTGKYKYEIVPGNGADICEFTTTSDNAQLFEVIKSSRILDDRYGISLLKQSGSWYYYFATPTDTPSNSSEYATLYKDIDSIKSTIKITDTSILVKESFFSLELPSNWSNKYKYEIIPGNGADICEFTTTSDNAQLFEVIRSYKELENRPGLILLEQSGSKYYYFATPTDTPSNSSEYATLYKDVTNIKNTIIIFNN